MCLGGEHQCRSKDHFRRMPRKRKRQIQGTRAWEKSKHMKENENKLSNTEKENITTEGFEYVSEDTWSENGDSADESDDESCGGDCQNGCNSKNRLSTDKAVNCHQMVIEDQSWVSIEGNRMVDVDYLLRWILALTNQHNKDCDKPNFSLVEEKFSCMVSTIFLLCKTCNTIYKGKTENPTNPGSLRKSTVWSVVASGETHAHAEEFFALMGSPFMCFSSFLKTEHEMYDKVQEMAERSMEKAIQEEKILADDHDENGIPCTKIFLDGSWPKRSYGGKYASKSGAAVMIGGKTKKVLYGNTKNTFCIKCYLDTKNEKQEDHKCFKNFDGAAGAIEPAILLEGFDHIFQLGLKGRIVVGDGDSSVFDQLKNKCVYGEELEKANCKNHAIKNLKKHLHSIAGKNQNDVARTALRDNIERLCAGVHAAILHCAKEGGIDVDGLRNDIQNSVNHVFGCHDNCRSYFCDKKNSPEALELLKSDEVVFNAVRSLLESLAAEADRLRLGESTNVAENFMSVIVKFIMGKRLNICSRGAYSLRVLLAILQYNEGYGWSKDALVSFMGRTQHPPAYLKYVKNRDSKRLKTSTLKSAGYQRGCTRTVVNEVDYCPGISALPSKTDKAEAVQRKKLEYQIDNDVYAKDASILTLSQISKGRIITKNISDIIKTRKQEKLNDKAEICSSLSHNERSFRKTKCTSSYAKNYMSNTYGQQFSGPCLRVRKEYPFICAVISGVSEDGDIIFLAKIVELHHKKKMFSKLTIAAAELPNLGVRIKNGVPEADGACIIEAQSCMFLFGAKKCIILFVNASNYDDNLSVCIEFEEHYFIHKIKPELLSFIDNYYVTNIVKKNIIPRKCINN